MRKTLSANTFTEVNPRRWNASTVQVSDLEVVVAREGNEEVKKKTFAVFIDLCSIMVHTWKKTPQGKVLITSRNSEFEKPDAGLKRPVDHVKTL